MRNIDANRGDGCDEGGRHDVYGGEAANLVDVVVNVRTSRRGLFSAVGCAVLAAVVSGCAAKLKSVVGDDALGGAGRLAGSAVPSSSNAAGGVRGGQIGRSSDEICRKAEGELEVPLDAFSSDLTLESRRMYMQFKRDEAEADRKVKDITLLDLPRYDDRTIDVIEEIIGETYENYLNSRSRFAYNAFMENVVHVTDIMIYLQSIREGLAEAGYKYAVVSAGLFRLSVPDGDSKFVALFKSARKKKLCRLKEKVEGVSALSGSFSVVYSRLEDLLPEDFSKLPEVLYEN